jgi:hypothetical protein
MKTARSCDCRSCSYRTLTYFVILLFYLCKGRLNKIAVVDDCAPTTSVVLFPPRQSCLVWLSNIQKGIGVNKLTRLLLWSLARTSLLLQKDSFDSDGLISVNLSQVCLHPSMLRPTTPWRQQTGMIVAVVDSLQRVLGYKRTRLTALYDRDNLSQVCLHPSMLRPAATWRQEAGMIVAVVDSLQRVLGYKRTRLTVLYDSDNLSQVCLHTFMLHPMPQRDVNKLERLLLSSTRSAESFVTTRTRLTVGGERQSFSSLSTPIHATPNHTVPSTQTGKIAAMVDSLRRVLCYYEDSFDSVRSKRQSFSSLSTPIHATPNNNIASKNWKDSCYGRLAPTSPSLQKDSFDSVDHSRLSFKFVYTQGTFSDDFFLKKLEQQAIKATHPSL